MLVGVPKEIKNHEYQGRTDSLSPRVNISQSGHSVIIETGCRDWASARPTQDYRRPSAPNVVDTAQRKCSRALT